MIKTSIAVFLCFCVDLLRNGTGISLNAAVAAVLCTQPSVSDSREAAQNRIIGTFIGGITGAVFVALENMMVPVDWLILHYVLVSLAIIPVIYITVHLFHSDTASLACVVFLIITVTRDHSLSPVAFAINRMLDTLVGIIISLIINVGGFFLTKRVKYYKWKNGSKKTPKEKPLKEKSEEKNIEEGDAKESVPGSRKNRDLKTKEKKSPKHKKKKKKRKKKNKK